MWTIVGFFLIMRLFAVRRRCFFLFFNCVFLMQAGASAHFLPHDPYARKAGTDFDF